MKRGWGAAIAVGLLIALVPALPADARTPTKVVHCGDTIKKSIKIANNLDCPGLGLTIGKSGITIDLGPHLLTDGTNAINDPAPGHSDVTIKGGVIRNFDHAILAVGNPKGWTISGLTIEDSDLEAILIHGSGHHLQNSTLINNHGGASWAVNNGTIKGNRATGTGIGGASFDIGGTSNAVSGNSSYGDIVGFTVTGDKNKLTSNTAIGATGNAGFQVQGGKKNTFTSNVSRDSTFDGFAVFGGLDSEDNTFSKNVATGNGDHGFEAGNSTRTTFVDNDANANAQTGIAVVDGTGTVIDGNRAYENGLHGISSDTPDISVTNNDADSNGFYDNVDNNVGNGISLPGSSSGSGNTAVGNDAVAQCTLAFMCTSGTAPVTQFTATKLSCGAFVNGNVSLTNDIDCVGDGGIGLQVTANNVHIDLRGHRIYGDQNIGNFGIWTDGHNHVEVSDGVLNGWGVGVRIDDGSSHATVSGLVIDNPSEGGIYQTGSITGDFENNVILHSTGDAMKFEDSNNGPNIVSNVLANNNLSAVHLVDVAGAAVEANLSLSNNAGVFDDQGANSQVFNNEILASDANGIQADSSDNLKILTNTIIGSGFSGVSIGGSNVDTAQGGNFDGNTAFANVQNGFNLDEFSTVTTVTNNKASGNGIIGIGFDGAATGSATKNAAIGNSNTGIFSANATVTLNKNKAKFNGFDNGVDNNTGRGISGPVGEPGSGNVASKNDDPIQCSPSSLC